MPEEISTLDIYKKELYHIDSLIVDTTKKFNCEINNLLKTRRSVEENIRILEGKKDKQ